MQHRERRLLLDGIAELVDELYGAGGSEQRQVLLRQRLDPVLDNFLLEARPIVGTEVTILLADIRGFTALTHTLAPLTLINLLNRYFTVMCDVIQRHDGVIDKFMGDSVMALFGAPRRRPDDVERALCCAAEMQHAMAAMNRESRSRGEPDLYAGIAVNTGPAMAGSFGSALHSEYTVIGDAVNLVSRMESFSLRGQVLISDSSRIAAGQGIETGQVNQVRVKGMAEPLILYELRSVSMPRRVTVPRVEVRKSPRIAVDLDAIFRQIESKRVHREHFIGHVRDMGYYGLRADLPLGLPAYSEVVVNLDPSAPTGVEHEVYARVLRSVPVGPGFRTSMEFTAIGTPGHQRVKQYVDEYLWRR